MTPGPSGFVVAADGKGGCPEIVWDGPYRMRCGMGIDNCSRHGRFQAVPRPQAAPASTPAERVETAAQVLHDRRHPLGYGDTCDRCRADARAVADVLNPKETR